MAETVEEHVHYFIKRGEFTTIEPKAEGEKVHFDSPEAEKHLQRCLEPMIAEARRGIAEMPQSGYFRNCSLCNATMENLFFEPFGFALCLERDLNVDGSALLLLSVAEYGAEPCDYSVMLAYGKRDSLLEAVGQLSFQAGLLRQMKRLMAVHRSH